MRGEPPRSGTLARAVNPLWQWPFLFASAAIAGAVNSIAGGGTLLTFPALLAAGVPPIAANATSTVALVPGSAAAFWGYRDTLRHDGRTLAAMGVPSVVGGTAGALLVLRAGDHAFAVLVPWLLLGATVLFMVQGPIANRLAAARANSDQRGGSDSPAARSAPTLAAWAGLVTFQLVVSVYGGFFGAGMGILMLAALGLTGMTDIHRMNAFKNFAAVCINGVATVAFIASGRVQWQLAGVMAVGAIAGGLLGARVAKRVGQVRVRQGVVAIGLAITAAMFWRQVR